MAFASDHPLVTDLMVFIQSLRLLVTQSSPASVSSYYRIQRGCDLSRNKGWTIKCASGLMRSGVLLAGDVGLGATSIEAERVLDRL